MRLCSHAAFILVCLYGSVSYASDLELTHATIYTEPGRPAIRDGAILIHNDRIVAVGPTAALTKRAVRMHVEVYDCSGLSITAGFWNSHVHMIPEPLLHAGPKVWTGSRQPGGLVSVSASRCGSPLNPSRPRRSRMRLR